MCPPRISILLTDLCAWLGCTRSPHHWIPFQIQASNGTFYWNKGVAIAVPVQTAWLRWGSCADQFVPTIHLSLLANEPSSIKVNSGKGQGQMLPSQQETKARFPRICSVCFLCHFYSCKPRGRGLGLSLPLSEGTVWAWGLPHHCYYPSLAPLLASVSTEPVKEIWEWAGPFLGIPWSHLTLSRDFAL